MLERETLHGMDDQRRIALVETLTFELKDGVGGRIENPVAVIRYQLDNHLGSASLELDGAGQVISYEEYYPYGTTSYQAGRSVAEVSLKRYRYTGKERDEETGLYYHGARYYAAWLGRWISCDPIGIADGVNVYKYCVGNPIKNTDPTGNDSSPAQKNQSDEKNSSQKYELKMSGNVSVDGQLKDVFYNPNLSFTGLRGNAKLHLNNDHLATADVNLFQASTQSTNILSGSFQLTNPTFSVEANGVYLSSPKSEGESVNSHPGWVLDLPWKSENSFSLKLTAPKNNLSDIQGSLRLDSKTTFASLLEIHSGFKYDLRSGNFHGNSNSRIFGIPFAGLWFRGNHDAITSSFTGTYEFALPIGGGFGKFSYSPSTGFKNYALYGGLQAGALSAFGNRDLARSFAKSADNPYAAVQVSTSITWGITVFTPRANISFGAGSVSLINETRANPSLPFPFTVFEKPLFGTSKTQDYGWFAGAKISGSF